MNHDPSRRLPALREAKTAVADSATRWADPGALQEDLANVFAIAIQETRSAKLTPDPATISIVADGFGVYGLLPALVTRGAVDSVVDFVRRLDGYFVDL